MSQTVLQINEAVNIYLMPGGFHFGDKNTHIHTVLGSCVSVAVWHPALCIGGMCHFVLPNRRKQNNSPLDGHYADEAIQLILREIGKHNTTPPEYQVKLFGGGNMFRQSPGKSSINVAEDNIEAARVLLKASNLNIHAEHVGGDGHRRVIFDLSDGSVLVKHQQPLP